MLYWFSLNHLSASMKFCHWIFSRSKASDANIAIIANFVYLRKTLLQHRYRICLLSSIEFSNLLNQFFVEFRQPDPGIHGNLYCKGLQNHKQPSAQCYLLVRHWHVQTEQIRHLVTHGRRISRKTDTKIFSYFLNNLNFSLQSQFRPSLRERFTRGIFLQNDSILPYISCGKVIFLFLNPVLSFDSGSIFLILCIHSGANLWVVNPHA